MDEQQTQVEPEAQADGNDALRAVLDQFEAAERELRAADEVRRAREEDVNRLRGEIGGAVVAALESCRTERVEVEQRLKAIDERIQELEGIRSRYGSDASVPAADAASVPPAPANAGWVTTEIPATTTPEVGGGEAGGEATGEAETAGEQPSEQASDQASDQAAEAPAEANADAGDGQGGSYEDGWYEVLKQRGKN